MKGRTFPTIEQVRQLPVQLTTDVPIDWEDRNGHVNVQYYLALYEMGGYQVLEDVGIDDAYLVDHNIGMFDLEHHTSYRAEILVGDEVSCYNRILARGDKLFHGMYFIVNNSRETLAGTIEYLTAAVNLGLRRITPFPSAMNQAIARQLAAHQELPWAAPVCGAIKIR